MNPPGIRGKKLRKLLQTPDIFFRDMLLKHFPTLDSRLLKLPQIVSHRHAQTVSDASGAIVPKLGGVPVFRMARGLRFPIHGIPSYAANAIAERLADIAGAMITIDGGPPVATVMLKKHRYLRSLRNCSSFSVYAGVGQELEVAVFSMWDVTGGFLTARSDHLSAKRIALDALGSGQDVIAPDHAPDSRAPEGPIDAIYTWVNAADPNWQELLRNFCGDRQVDWDRFVQTDELRYSLRSLFMHAPWIGNVYVLSNCRPPDWFSPHPRVHWIAHEEVIPSEYLPLFNSNAIESFLWHIDGLAEQFIYLNDDFFLGRYFDPSEFFQGNGASISRFDDYAIVPAILDQSGGRTEEWEAATANAANYFYARYGSFPGQLHKHAPYCARRSVAKLMERDFAEAFATLRENRFRSPNDIPPISFLYPHYARQNRYSECVSSQSAVIDHNNFRQLLEEIKSGRHHDFYCLNDGGSSSSNAAFNDFKRAFGELMFPMPSPCEKPVAGR